MLSHSVAESGSSFIGNTLRTRAKVSCIIQMYSSKCSITFGFTYFYIKYI